MMKLLATTALVLCTLGTVNAAELPPYEELVKARSVLINPQRQYVADNATTVIDPSTGQPAERLHLWSWTLEYCGQNPQPNYCPEVPADLARLMFDPQSIAEWDQQPWTQERARQWFWAQYRANHPLTTDNREAAPLGLVGEPYPPGSEFPIAGIGSDYAAQARVERAVAQNCPQPTAEADARECSGQQVAVPLPRPNPFKANAQAPQGTQGTEAAEENEAAGRPFWQLEKE
jgi:hypothetical protein